MAHFLGVFVVVDMLPSKSSHSNTIHILYVEKFTSKILSIFQSRKFHHRNTSLTICRCSLVTHDAFGQSQVVFNVEQSLRIFVCLEWF